ncbi:MAG: SiaB family protein kinase [Bacteroidales bacterium]|nr:SiaB family protein kinase [Bacteroidales bacterium]
MGFSDNSKGFINYIYDRYKDLKIKDISLVFEGQVTHQVMKALTGLVEEQLDEVEEYMVLRRVYHVMVESLQNINRHAESYEYRGHPYPGMGLILVAKNSERFQVTTGNIVDNGYVEDISMFLGKLNNMDSDRLDDLYKQQLRDGVLSPKGGAGLGFIDIKRKTGNPLDYSFVKIDEETSFFIFTSTISR